MDADSLLATALLKCIVDAGGTEFRLEGLVELSRLTAREVDRAVKRLEEWKAVSAEWEREGERQRLKSIAATDATYTVYRRLFENSPAS